MIGQQQALVALIIIKQGPLPPFCTSLLPRRKRRSMLTRWEICSNTVAPSHGPVLESLEWRCLGIDFAVAILSWISPHLSITQTQRMDANSKNFFFHDLKLYVFNMWENC